jgi:hypothetical protein
MLLRLVLVCSFALVWTTSHAISALASVPATAGVQGRAQRDQNRTCAGALVERRVQFFYLTGARAGVVAGSNPRSMKKSVRRRADSTETGGGDDANQTTTEEIERWIEECEEVEPDPAWSPECWGHHSSVEKGLSCNCLGPMDLGA